MIDHIHLQSCDQGTYLLVPYDELYESLLLQLHQARIGGKGCYVFGVHVDEVTRDPVCVAVP